VIKYQTDRRAYSAEDHVIITTLLLLQPRWSQTLITQALDINKSFISKAKTKAIRLGLMDKKRIPTAKGIEYLEWAKTQYDIFAYAKRLNQFSSEIMNLSGKLE
jgi:hypothetical protein